MSDQSTSGLAAVPETMRRFWVAMPLVPAETVCRCKSRTQLRLVSRKLDLWIHHWRALSCHVRSSAAGEPATL
jgi:hypothetical protein